jgi:galactokinase
VVAGFAARGWTVEPFDAVIHSSVPLGGGLSSSAALEVATATLLEAMRGESLDPREKALLCQQAEHRFAGMPCGIMDQFSSVLGKANHLMLLDCRLQAVKMIPLTESRIAVLIANSNVRHELTGGEYAERRAQCEQSAQILKVASLRDATPQQVADSGAQLGPELLRRARHVTSENERTASAAAAIRAGDWQQVGAMMYSSHASLRDDFEVSCQELDLLVDLARQLPGVIGSRMTGGGFGGCTVSLVWTEHMAEIIQAMSEEYRRQTQIEPTLFTTRPAQGAQILDSR